MSSTSRRISEKTKPSRNSHTPGNKKGGNCVRNPAAMYAVSVNPYKGQGIEASKRDGYNRWWNRKIADNGGKAVAQE